MLDRLGITRIATYFPPGTRDNIHLACRHGEDEKFVTEKAYNNPKFVEDIARDVSKILMEDENITWFSVSAENFESIHNHSAYAYIEK